MTSSKHDYANYDQFPPNFDMTYKTIQSVSVPNVKLFGPMKKEIRAKEAAEFSITLYGKMGWWAHHYGCRNIKMNRDFLNFEQA